MSVGSSQLAVVCLTFRTPDADPMNLADHVPDLGAILVPNAEDREDEQMPSDSNDIMEDEHSAHVQHNGWSLARRSQFG